MWPEESRAAVFDGARGAAFRVAFLVVGASEPGTRVVDVGGGSSRRRRACVGSVAPPCHARAVVASDVGEDDGAASRDGGIGARRRGALVLLARLVPLEGELDEAPLRFAMCASRRRRTSSARSSSAVSRRCERFRESVTTHCWRKSSSSGGKEPPRVSVHRREAARSDASRAGLGTDDVEDVLRRERRRNRRNARGSSPSGRPRARSPRRAGRSRGRRHPGRVSSPSSRAVDVGRRHRSCSCRRHPFRPRPDRPSCRTDAAISRHRCHRSRQQRPRPTTPLPFASSLPSARAAVVAVARRAPPWSTPRRVLRPSWESVPPMVPAPSRTSPLVTPVSVPSWMPSPSPSEARVGDEAVVPGRSGFVAAATAAPSSSVAARRGVG